MAVAIYVTGISTPEVHPEFPPSRDVNRPDHFYDPMSIPQTCRAQPTLGPPGSDPEAWPGSRTQPCGRDLGGFGGSANEDAGQLLEASGFHHTGVKRFHYTLVGDLALTYEALSLPADPGLTIFAYTAEPNSPLHEALNLLASWTRRPTIGEAIGAIKHRATPSLVRELPGARRCRDLPSCRLLRSTPRPSCRRRARTGTCAPRAPRHRRARGSSRHRTPCPARTGTCTPCAGSSSRPPTPLRIPDGGPPLLAHVVCLPRAVSSFPGSPGPPFWRRGGRGACQSLAGDRRQRSSRGPPSLAVLNPLNSSHRSRHGVLGPPS
jgi:hypothetical protein